MSTPAPHVVPATAYQSEIYLAGLAGRAPELPTDLTELAALAEQRLDSGPYWYVAGGAGSGATMRANRAAFDTARESRSSAEVQGRGLVGQAMACSR